MWLCAVSHFYAEHTHWMTKANTFILEPHKYSVGSAGLLSTQCQIVFEFVSNFCHSLRQDVTSRIFAVSPLYCSFLTHPEETSNSSFFWERKISQAFRPSLACLQLDSMTLKVFSNRSDYSSSCELFHIEHSV